MNRPKHDPQIAVELVKAGYRQLTKKYHPDLRGGSHEAMLVLGATRDHLESLLRGGAGGGATFRTTEQPKSKTSGSSYYRQDNTPRFDIPLEPFDHESYLIRDVVLVRESEKAYCIRIPGIHVNQWVPRSQIWVPTPVPTEGDCFDIRVSHWIANQKGWFMKP